MRTMRPGSVRHAPTSFNRRMRKRGSLTTIKRTHDNMETAMTTAQTPASTPHQTEHAPRPYSLARPCHADDVPQWDIETDVAVIGFGAAGSCAAIEARAAGAQVHVFEVAAAPGGSASWSGGEVYVGGSGGTRVQKAHGFEDSTEDFYTYLMMAGGPGADAERVRLYADHAVAHYDWL